MERLTDRTRAQKIKENADKLRAAGVAVSPDHELYIRLAEYENAEEISARRKEKCKEILNYYGAESQLRELAVECADLLIQAVSKWQKIADDKGEEHLIEEAADVKIMLWQLQYMISLDGEARKMNEIIDYKLDRQLMRIAEEIENEGGDD